LLEAIVIISFLVVVGLIAYPRRSAWVRWTTKTYNGQPHWQDKE